MNYGIRKPQTIAVTDAQAESLDVILHRTHTAASLPHGRSSRVARASAAWCGRFGTKVFTARVLAVLAVVAFCSAVSGPTAVMKLPKSMAIQAVATGVV